MFKLSLEELTVVRLATLNAAIVEKCSKNELEITDALAIIRDINKIKSTLVKEITDWYLVTGLIFKLCDLIFNSLIEISAEDRLTRETCSFDTCAVCNDDRRAKCRTITQEHVLTRV